MIANALEMVGCSARYLGQILVVIGEGDRQSERNLLEGSANTRDHLSSGDGGTRVPFMIRQTTVKR